MTEKENVGELLGSGAHATVTFIIHISNDPTWWPTITGSRVSSYFSVAAFVIVTYDWALTFGQEVALVWKQRWSLMSVLYLGVRYLGILYATSTVLNNVPTISLTDTVSWIISVIQSWISVLVSVMLWAIIVTRLHAMYQRSKKILIFLIVTFLAISVFVGMVTIMTMIHTSGEEHILSGSYHCWIDYAENTLLLLSISWILSSVWEALALCLAIWIVVKHFRELRQHSAGGIIRESFTVLMKTHVVYFASFVVVSCCQLIIDFSPTLSAGISLDAQLYGGFLQIVSVVQMFVLGPRMILGIREYYAKLRADSDTAATAMSSMAFQERVHVSTGSGV
ncbi:uncharacterized protein HD556DRAFT_198437 [Suillus plorans]|uniref:DUF6533 domain-containing protein n=1 Tax=Suillus plorans TaxID=116603 RepID=A0A9P7DMR2_9AGAM|nr:uncharacterized protein HD556DRAFT_198437 [Suillus plorans]KAG1798660.1 hypothetical protein HD556DRAFT_198437 [Suillus plorans]